MNCDAIAPYYAAMEFAVFGRTLERCRFHLLPELASSRQALILGDGDGRFLRKLLRSCPELQADYVDSSEGMLRLARSAVGEARVRYSRADVLRDPLPKASYDLVAAHFFFDCFDANQLPHLVERVRAAAPNARWLVSEFGVPRNRWLCAPARGLIATMYGFFGLTTGLRTRSLVDHRAFLERAGLTRIRSAEHARGLLVSELWSPRT